METTAGKRYHKKTLRIIKERTWPQGVNKQEDEFDVKTVATK